LAGARGLKIPDRKVEGWKKSDKHQDSYLLKLLRKFLYAEEKGPRRARTAKAEGGRKFRKKRGGKKGQMNQNSYRSEENRGGLPCISAAKKVACHEKKGGGEENQGRRSSMVGRGATKKLALGGEKFSMVMSGFRRSSTSNRRRNRKKKKTPSKKMDDLRGTALVQRNDTTASTCVRKEGKEMAVG